jgi:hypothetical protein
VTEISTASPEDERPIPSAVLNLTAWLGFGAFVPLLMSFLLGPAVLTRYLCPSDMFMDGLMGLSNGTYGTLVFLASCVAFWYYTANRNADSASSPRVSAMRESAGYKFLFLILPACGMCLSAILWVGSAGSVFCLMPNRILLHPSALGSWRSLTWEDVKVVQVGCWRDVEWKQTNLPGRRMTGRSLVQIPSGGLSLAFDDGEAIQMALPNGGNALAIDYFGIKAALANKHYHYQRSDSVTRDLCPPEIYPMFLNW